MLDRYEELKSRLSHEIDLVEMVSVQRQARLVIQLVLSKYHRYYIPSFKNY